MICFRIYFKPSVEHFLIKLVDFSQTWNLLKICSFGKVKLGYGMKFEQGILTTVEEQLPYMQPPSDINALPRLQISTIVHGRRWNFVLCFFIWNNFLANLSKLTIHVVNFGLNL